MRINKVRLSKLNVNVVRFEINSSDGYISNRTLKFKVSNFFGEVMIRNFKVFQIFYSNRSSLIIIYGNFFLT